MDYYNLQNYGYYANPVVTTAQNGINGIFANNNNNTSSFTPDLSFSMRNSTNSYCLNGLNNNTMSNYKVKFKILKIYYNWVLAIWRAFEDNEIKRGEKK